jgi:carboxymethylenebutenolidase
MGELDGLDKPVCVIWGDQDHVAPPPVQQAYHAAAKRKRTLEVHTFPGVQHGYMMRGSPNAYDPKMYEFSMNRALALLAPLKQQPATTSS